MAMGMSYDDYWHGDYTALPYYRKAYALKRQEANEKLWLQGIYIMNAIGCMIPKTDIKYPEEPYALTQKEKDEQAERRRKKEIEDARSYMETMMHNINKNRREGGENNG